MKTNIKARGAQTNTTNAESATLTIIYVYIQDTDKDIDLYLSHADYWLYKYTQHIGEASATGECLTPVNIPVNKKFNEIRVIFCCFSDTAK